MYILICALAMLIVSFLLCIFVARVYLLYAPLYFNTKCPDVETVKGKGLSRGVEPHYMDEHTSTLY